MGKLLVLFVVMSVVLKFLFRRNLLVKGRLFTWLMAFAAAILLLAFPWNPSQSTAGTVFVAIKLTGAFLLLVYLVYDVRRLTR